jgi:acyl-coenzyme A synthetase/AMP-(fatty) acid ligase
MECVFAPELPKSNFGKVLKIELRAWSAGVGVRE